MSGESGANEGAMDDAPIVRIAHTVIQHAIRDRASEVRVEPHAEAMTVIS